LEAGNDAHKHGAGARVDYGWAVSAAQIAPVVIGGLVTLSVTFVVQVFVIPRVQTGTRRRERWEKNVLELSALLEEEMPRAISGYKSAAYQVRYTKAWLGDDAYNQDRVRELWQTSKTELREADRVVGELMARLKVLDSRIRRVRPKAPYWGRLFMRRVKFQLAVWKIDIQPTEEPDPLDDDERWEEAWKSLQAAQDELIKTLDEIADPMKAPPRQFVYRVRRDVRQWVKKRWEARRAKQAELPGTPEATGTP
jgi:predicted transcriptional regulator